MQRDLSSADNTFVNSANEEMSGRGSGVTRTLEVCLDKNLMAKFCDKLSATQCRCNEQRCTALQDCLLEKLFSIPLYD